MKIQKINALATTSSTALKKLKATVTYSTLRSKAIFECAIIASAQAGSPAQRELLYFNPEMRDWEHAVT
jgi:hypothetical protein